MASLIESQMILIWSVFEETWPHKKWLELVGNLSIFVHKELHYDFRVIKTEIEGLGIWKLFEKGTEDGYLNSTWDVMISKP